MPKISREEILKLAQEHNLCHVVSAFSIVEILNALYEFKRDEDEIILSKGHGCLALYAMLIKLGYSPEMCGHPDMDVENGIQCTTGSLGHGLPIAVGKAIANKDKNIYVVMGDGECQEGTTWESAMIAHHYGLTNLTVIVDDNNLQCLGRTDEILDVGDLCEKFRAFGWDTVAVDGHSEEEIKDELKSYSTRPKMILAFTVKGKGLKFQGDADYHVCIPKDEDMIQ